MTTAYIAISPGTTYPDITIQAYDAAGTTLVTGGNLDLIASKDIVFNASNDVFSWTQMNEAAKLQIATTSTNSVAINLVLTRPTFIGNAAATAGTAQYLGVAGLSSTKRKVHLTVTNAVGGNVACDAYLTGLAPKTSADQPIWETPVTFTVSGDYTWS
jgi:hypothetical protein